MASAAEGVVVRERLVELDPSTLSAEVTGRAADAGPGRVSLPLFPDVDVDVITDSLEPTAESYTNWTGHTPDVDYTNAVFVVRGDQITGNITVGDRFFIVRPVEDRMHRIVEINRDAFPEELEPGEPEVDIQDQEGRDVPLPSMHETPVIDIMVVYNDAAEQGSSDINAEIALAVLETNVSYRNSGINQRIRLVHS